MRSDLRDALSGLSPEDRRRLVARIRARDRPRPPGPRLSVFFFGFGGQRSAPYDLVLKCGIRADTNGLHAIWTPERHFHEFGGPYPEPSLLAAALAGHTSRIGLRAGSVILPLSHPARLAERWSVVDQLSGGRVGLACAAGWHPHDFVLGDVAYEDRHAALATGLEQLRSLWSGQAVTFAAGSGEPVAVRTYPRPVQPELPLWLTCSKAGEGWLTAARHDTNVLTGLMEQTPEGLGDAIRAYREERDAHGLGWGQVTLMLHTYVGPSDAEARARARPALAGDLRSHLGFFETVIRARDVGIDPDELSEADREELIQRGVDRVSGDQRHDLRAGPGRRAGLPVLGAGCRRAGLPGGFRPRRRAGTGRDRPTRRGARGTWRPGFTNMTSGRWLRRSQYVAAEDGTPLAVHVFCPQHGDGPLPALWCVDRYHLVHQLVQDPTTPLRNWLERLLDGGFVVALMDVRGSGASFGRWDGPFSAGEIRDARHLGGWLAGQDFCTGRTGMIGRSYSAIVQPLVAAQPPTGLRAIFAEMPMIDPYGFARSGGILRHDFLDNWTARIRALDRLPNAVPVDADPTGASLAAAQAQHRDNSDPYDLVTRLPYWDSTEPDGTLPYLSVPRWPSSTTCSGPGSRSACGPGGWTCGRPMLSGPIWRSGRAAGW